MANEPPNGATSASPTIGNQPSTSDELLTVAALCFLAYLLLCRFVVSKTGKTEGLRDVATAMRAYKVPLPSRSGRDSDKQ